MNNKARETIGRGTRHRDMVEPDSFDALTTRFLTAGLFRRGERLCRDAHAVSIPRNEAGDDDDEADEEEEYYVCDDYDSPWDPIPVERVRSKETRDALGPFQCRGACPGDQDQDGRSSHEVHAPRAVATITVTHFDRWPSRTTVYFRCEACQAEAEKSEKEARDREDAYQEECYRDHRKMAKEEASRKRKRASQVSLFLTSYTWAIKLTPCFVQAAKARLRDEDDETPEHLEFKGTLKKLKSPRLKDVCKANHLMVAGSKSDLLERIVGCRLHGHSWRCPDCGKSCADCPHVRSTTRILPIARLFS